jgi:hypothetical protein
MQGRTRIICEILDSSGDYLSDKNEDIVGAYVPVFGRPA